MGLCARDIMQDDVEVVTPDLRLPDLERAFLDKRATGFPVVENGRLVGVVSRSDVVRHSSVERSIAGELSDYYRSPEVSQPDDERESDAEAAEVGMRIAETVVREVMSDAVVCVRPTDPIDEVARALVERRIHRVPVVDDDRLVGIISSLDLVRLMADGRAVAS